MVLDAMDTVAEFAAFTLEGVELLAGGRSLDNRVAIVDVDLDELYFGIELGNSIFVISDRFLAFGGVRCLDVEIDDRNRRERCYADNRAPDERRARFVGWNWGFVYHGGIITYNYFF